MKEVAHAVIEMSDLTEGAGQWEEWDESSHPPQGREDPPQLQTRSRREEKQLWAILSELDRKQYHKEQKEQAKKLGAVARARKKMGADKAQPSIYEKLMGGPSHQLGVRAPPQQRNTRARGHTSQKNKESQERWK